MTPPLHSTARHPPIHNEFHYSHLTHMAAWVNTLKHGLNVRSCDKEQLIFKQKHTLIYVKALQWCPTYWSLCSRPASVQYAADVAVRIQADIMQTFHISMVCAALIAHLIILDWIACWRTKITKSVISQLFPPNTSSAPSSWTLEQNLVQNKQNAFCSKEIKSTSFRVVYLKQCKCWLALMSETCNLLLGN